MMYTIFIMISSDLESLLNQLPEHKQAQVKDYVKSLLLEASQNKTKKGTRKLGLHAGAFQMHPDFDKPLEFEESFKHEN